MEFVGTALIIDSSDTHDRRVLSDLVLASARVAFERAYDRDPMQLYLYNKVSTSTPHGLNDNNPRPPLELTIDELGICIDMLKAARASHKVSPLPLESMRQTRKELIKMFHHDSE